MYSQLIAPTQAGAALIAQRTRYDAKVFAEVSGFKTDRKVEYENAAPKDDVFWEFYMVFLGSFCVVTEATIKTLTLSGHFAQQVGAAKPIPIIRNQLIAAFCRIG